MHMRFFPPSDDIDYHDKHLERPHSKQTKKPRIHNPKIKLGSYSFIHSILNSTVDFVEINKQIGFLEQLVLTKLQPHLMKVQLAKHTDGLTTKYQLMSC